MEEDGEDLQSPAERKRSKGEESVDKIEQWLSPLSDHFPTPRGLHFLSAPLLPATPSAVSDGCDVDDTSSETSSSNPSTQTWNRRESIMTEATEFDDMSDISEDGGDMSRKEQLRGNGISRQHGSRGSRGSRRASKARSETWKSLTPLVIPTKSGSGTEAWSGAAHLKKITSPVPPTPSSIVELLSPVQLAFMKAQHESEVPTISAPPSLDGSLNSEELAAMSAPPTPLIGGKDEDDEGWSGVQLQPDALATLQALSANDDDYGDQPSQVIEVPQEEMSEMPPRAPRLITNVRPTSVLASPAQHRSFPGLTRLDIPSPGGFFAELSSASRNTWHAPRHPTDDIVPPTSTTAEQFYKAPWNKEDSDPPPPPLPPPPPPPARPLHLENVDFPSAVVERVLELPGPQAEGPPTAIRIQPTPEPVTARRIPSAHPLSPETEGPDPSSSLAKAPSEQASSPIDATEIVDHHDPDYARQQKSASLSHIDRTEMWLMAQRAYLGGVISSCEIAQVTCAEDEPHGSSETPTEKVEVEEPGPKPEPAGPLVQKKVRFTESVMQASVPRRLPSKLARQESAYYRAFTDLIIRSQRQDAFVHRLPRFEALQAQRVSLRETHRNQLLGKYQLSVVPQSAKKRMSANVARGDAVLFDDPEKLRADKEHDALSQMLMAGWHVGAAIMLNGGQLLAAPIAKRLARRPRSQLGPDGMTRDRTRILDLGGQGACDWAWHAALKYPNAKIYTVTTKTIRQISNSNIRGPPNHRQVAVGRLTRLPFADDQFDLVSARELHSILKFIGENGEDEWEACLAECMRVLKPGGYLEFSVLDSDMINAGPLGLAKSVEFGFTLRTLGYDPAPSRLFLGRLHRAGFRGVRRAWVCLPVGPKPAAKPAAPRPDSAADLPAARAPGPEAAASGSADNAAALTGLAAGWSWERWLLRTEMEKIAGELRLADTVTTGDKMREAGRGIWGVREVVDEGRARGAAFRMLRGYARKPNPEVAVVGMVC